MYLRESDNINLFFFITNNYITDDDIYSYYCRLKSNTCKTYPKSMLKYLLAVAKQTTTVIQKA